MKFSKTVKTVLTAAFIFGAFSAAQAGDADVDVDLIQDISAKTVNVESEDGNASAEIGSIAAYDGSVLTADIETEIVNTLTDVQTDGGHASASIGSVTAGAASE